MREMLGGTVRDVVPIYASSLGPEAVEETAKVCKEKGFNAVKAKIGFSPEEDERILAQIRSTLGEEVKLFADANQAWRLKEALILADVLQRYKVDWIEEPIRGNQLEDLEAFHSNTGMTIATGENVYGAAGFWRYAASPYVGILQPDVSKTGGISETLRICHLSLAAGKAVIPHLYAGPLALAATLQLAGCIPQIDYVEFDVLDNPFRDELLVEPLTPNRGCLAIPEGPGLGVDLDFEAVAKYAEV
jgi:L-alanine-DL-glutamate epimerase-like enolase superfamily enzyme